MRKILLLLILLLSLNCSSQYYESGKQYTQQYDISEECEDCYCRIAEWKKKKVENWRYIKKGDIYVYTKCFYYVYWFEYVEYNICDENYPL